MIEGLSSIVAGDGKNRNEQNSPRGLLKGKGEEDKINKEVKEWGREDKNNSGGPNGVTAEG